MYKYTTGMALALRIDLMSFDPSYIHVWLLHSPEAIILLHRLFLQGSALFFFRLSGRDHDEARGTDPQARHVLAPRSSQFPKYTARACFAAD